MPVKAERVPQGERGLIAGRRKEEEDKGASDTPCFEFLLQIKAE